MHLILTCLQPCNIFIGIDTISCEIDIFYSNPRIKGFRAPIFQETDIRLQCSKNIFFYSQNEMNFL